ncbi:MAG: single-stranded DNA-binding protein [Ectothiorhodospiraceae bacterium AqS1]|nr:single-stranded DNA-binding protein [Ectothiorhodospiraceae bacterium AqS1]
MSASPLIAIARELSRDTHALRFAPPVHRVYNPLEYAWAPHRRYLELFSRCRKESPAKAKAPILLLGINPGPFGMAQTGVPFGDVELTRNWLGIEAKVYRPSPEHPRRPVHGFECRRREMSGQRLWGWARDRFGDPNRFFQRFFVWNYCPLCFMEDSGRNRTPDKLPPQERETLFAICDRALVRVARHLGLRHIIGIGQFATRRARTALGDKVPHIHYAPHPSPASPIANRGWAGAFEESLEQAGIAPFAKKRTRAAPLR